MNLDHAKIILDQLDCGIIILDEQLRVLFWNKWLSNRTHRDKDSVDNKNLISHPDIDEKVLKRKILTALTINSPAFFQSSKNQYLIKVPLQRITNEVFSHMQQSVTIAPYDLKKRLVCIYIYDITANCEVNYQLNQLNQDLEQRVKTEIIKSRRKDDVIRAKYKQAAMGNLISVIAHQLKQPLNVMGLTTQYVIKAYEKRVQEYSLVREKLDKTMDNIRFMTTTIDDFKDFFNPHKKIQQFSLRECILKAVCLMENQLDKNGILLETQIEQDVIIYSYQSELIQVILNLINNAEDALVENQVENPKITIDLKLCNTHATILIQDNAGGIPEHVMAQLFQAYVTTKGSQGTGLGLNICKAIIEESMKGEIVAENKEAGAEFTITLPITAPDSN